MYQLSTTINFYNRMEFSSLVSAIAKAKLLLSIHPGRVIDVIRPINRDYIRVVWTCDSTGRCIIKAN